MKMFFAFLMLATFWIVLEPPEDQGGILSTVLKEEKLQRKKDPATFRTVSEFSRNEFKQNVEIRKSFDEKDRPLKELSFYDGKRFGQQKYFQNGKLQQSDWHFGPGKKNKISIFYNDEGKVIEASCKGLKFTEEHEIVCGFRAPYEI